MNNLIESLVEHIQADPNYKPANGAYVSIYRRSQHFGGPEEGGWWYDRITLEGSKWFVSREEAERFLEASKAHVERMNKEEAPDRARAFASLPSEDDCCPSGYPEGYIPNGWSDGGELYVTVEDRQGQADNSNEPRPHYE
jgi:hypothetical protein